MSNSKVYKLLSGLNEIKWSIAVKGILAGFIAGVLAVMYRLGIEYGTETSIKIYSYLKVHPYVIIPWILIVAVVSLFIAWLIKLEPMATGSGIPQVEGIVLYGMKMKGHFIIIVRFLAGILSAFTGVSLGREGPSIQIGASGYQAVSKKISKNKLEENYLITGGAAAGLSAAFSAPLSGIVFALEEVHRSFSPLILIAATTASLTADVVSKYFFGLNPVLNFIKVPQLPLHLYLCLIPIGIISGLMGSLINKLLLGAQTVYNKLPEKIRPMIALFIALPVGLFLPQVLGGGQNLIEMAENAENGIRILLVLLTFKMLFTCTSFGSGVPGGIFMPILSVGALTGSVLGLIATQFGFSVEYIPVFCVCAMAGALSGSVKAPVTSILLTAEMTGSLVHLLPVAACSFIALFISDILNITPIYEELLERMTHGNEKEIKEKKQGVLIEVAVELGSGVCDKAICEICWPDGSLVVGIRRGDKEIVPNGTTKLLSGDYLVILSSQCLYKDINMKLRELCQSIYK